MLAGILGNVYQIEWQQKFSNQLPFFLQGQAVDYMRNLVSVNAADG